MYSPNTGASSSSSSSRNVQQLEDDGRNVDPKKRTSITMLVLGDEGVGKSSLISTFVSRHFSEVVPGIMTRVRLPPAENSCITTIVDSQGGDAALISAVASISTGAAAKASNITAGITSNMDTVGHSDVGGRNNIRRGGEQEIRMETAATTNSPSASNMSAIHSSTDSTYFASSNTNETLSALHSFSTSARRTSKSGIESVDSIILIYDLDRDETFFRLENHWLPLIERCYNGGLPVIVAGNKMDVFLPSSSVGVNDDQVLARSRQQIVSLMQRFRFIRQCIKCSAKNLLRVDEVFLKAQQAVLYPFTPLYDLDTGCLSENCRRSFTRIFRMYDRDHDGLLSHSELDRFQYETFHVPVYERDLTGWKKVVNRNNPNEEVVRDGKFTVAGFLAIFDVFISQNRLDVPWQALRSFSYDDNLNLKVPEYVYEGLEDASSWALSSSARRFLSDIFHQYDTDNDGVLSLDDIDEIFSIIPEQSLPPWHPIRARELFGECFSLPKMPYSELPKSESTGSTSSHFGAYSLSASGITITSNESFPSVDISSIGTSSRLSIPLAYLDYMGLWHAISVISPRITRAELFRLGHIEDTKTTRRRTRKELVASTRECSPDSLLPSRELRIVLLGSPSSGKTALINYLCGGRTKYTLTKTKVPETSSTYVRMKRKKKKSKKDETHETVAVHLIITDVPEVDAENRVIQQKYLAEIIASGGCDLVALAFDSTNSASLAYAKHLESSLLTEDISRVYVATKIDQCGSTEKDDCDRQSNTVIEEAKSHCRKLDLEPPLITSSSAGDLNKYDRIEVLGHLAYCCMNEPGFAHLRAKPHEERKRREESKRKNRKMIWFGVGVGVACFAVVGYLWTGASGSKGTSSTATAADQRSGRHFGWFHSFLVRAESRS